MNISQQRFLDDFFQNNSPQELKRWAASLKYFYFKRAMRGHSEETNDFFFSQFNLDDLSEFEDFLNLVGVSLEVSNEFSESLWDLNLTQPNRFYYNPTYQYNQFKWIRFNDFTFFISLYSDYVFEIRLPAANKFRFAPLVESDYQNCKFLECLIDTIRIATKRNNAIEVDSSVFSEANFPEFFK